MPARRWRMEAAYVVASALQTASCRFTALAYRFTTAFVIHRCKFLRVRTTVGCVLSCRDLTIGRLTASPVLVDLYLRLDFATQEY